MARYFSKAGRAELSDCDKLLQQARRIGDPDTVAAIDRLGRDNALDELLRKAGVENENLKFLALLTFEDRPSKKLAASKPGPNF